MKSISCICLHEYYAMKNIKAKLVRKNDKIRVSINSSF